MGLWMSPNKDWLLVAGCPSTEWRACMADRQVCHDAHAEYLGRAGPPSHGASFISR